MMSSDVADFDDYMVLCGYRRSQWRMNQDHPPTPRKRKEKKRREKETLLVIAAWCIYSMHTSHYMKYTKNIIAVMSE